MARSSMSAQLVEAAVWYLIGLSSESAGDTATKSAGSDAAEDTHVLRGLLALELGLDDDRVASPEDAAALDRVLSLISAGRAAASADPSTTVSAAGYGALRERALVELGAGTGRGLTPWPPTQQTVMKRLGDGSWAAALSALGLQAAAGRARGGVRFNDAGYAQSVADFVSAAGRARGGVRFNDAGYAQSVADFVSAAEAAGTGTAYAAYVEWCAAQKANGVDRPSGSALRVRFGSWNAALAAAE